MNFQKIPIYSASLKESVSLLASQAILRGWNHEEGTIAAGGYSLDFVL